MAEWMVAAKKADFDQWAAELHISPVTARLVRNRGVVSLEEAADFLRGERTHDAMRLPQMEQAARLLLSCRTESRRVRVIGDYDVDGICSSFLLAQGLVFCGLAADVRLPDRIREGYGLNVSLVEQAAEDGIDVILTCDNGIAAAEEVRAAAACGMKVIVTDHHEVPQDEEGHDILPEAQAVVDPKRADSEYPFHEICGAVVAYKLLEAMIALDGEDAPYTREEAAELLEALTPFTALATVCDVMPLSDENRGIVRKGLARMKETRNLGLRALMKVTGCDERSLNAYALGFILGPCLNASGRLDTATRALALFLSDDEREAVQLAEDLKEINDARKDMTVTATKEALALADAQRVNGILPKVLVLYLPDCHESIAGIVAGRVREALHHPVIVLTDALNDESGSVVKGSGRSIEAYDLYAALSKCADLFEKFGGHPMAAGMTLKKEQIDMLRNRLNASCDLPDEAFEEVLHIDMVLPLSVATLSLIKEFSCLEPFGKGNPQPLFAARSLKLQEVRRIGKEAQYARLTLEDAEGRHYEAMCFSDPGPVQTFFETHPGGRIHIVYEAQHNVYRGEERVQFILKDFREDTQ